MATKGHYQTGTVAATGAAINVPLGFLPSFVRLLNGAADDDWISGMTGGAVEPFTGTAAADADGFTVTAAASTNTTGTIYYAAWGEE